ncbi:MAG: hypothetical protein NTX49_03010 [Chlamydiae bacterium]|nr:hypothetical protein [Chlamydiota bacterium]
MSVSGVGRGGRPQDNSRKAEASNSAGMALPSGRHLSVEIGSPSLTPTCQAMSDLATPPERTPVSTLSERVITQSPSLGGFFSKMASAASSVFSPTATLTPGSRSSSASTVRSTSPTLIRDTSITTIKAESGRGIRDLRVDEMPSAAVSDQEYLPKLQSIFPSPGTSVTIALNPEVDVIRKPKELDEGKVLSTMANQWKEGSLASIAGISLPTVSAFEESFKASHEGQMPKYPDYKTFVTGWIQDNLPDIPVGKRLSSISEATSSVLFIRQIVKDYDRRAQLRINGQLPPEKVKEGASAAGGVAMGVEAGSSRSSKEIIEDWVERSLEGVEGPQRMRILSSIQQGITTPINKMADLLFNREFSRGYDGAAGGLSTIEPRSLEDVEDLKQDKTVSPNITEWVQNEGRGWGVSVNTKTNTLTATLFFGLKGSPDMLFKGEETIYIPTGRTSVTIARLE